MSDKPLLLVSVRDADEAEIAIAAGADIIDFKEPRAGSLGAVDDGTLLAALRRVEDQSCFSIACGELLSTPWMQPSDVHTEIIDHIQFMKVGLAGCAHRADWPTLWKQFVDSIPLRSKDPVGVAYVDAIAAEAPSIAEVITHTKAYGSHTLLLDTWGKTHGGLLNYVSLDELKQIRELTRRNRQRLCLAGSLDLATIERVLPIEPDVIAVRGAVCDGGREGRVDRGKVCGIVELLRRQSFPHA